MGDNQIMSYEYGLKLINLEATDRVGRTEYCDHGPLMTQISGRNADSPDFAEAVAARREFYRWAGMVQKVYLPQV